MKANNDVKQQLAVALREGHVVELQALGDTLTLRRVRPDDSCLVVEKMRDGTVQWALRKLHEIAFDATFEFGAIEVERALRNVNARGNETTSV